MDYPYFTAAPQPYQFLGLPPTPAHTGSANSDDFSNSPPVRSQPFSYVTYQSPLTARQDAFDQFQSFDYNQFNSNGLPAAKPPTPQHKPSMSANNGFDMPVDMNDDSNRRGSNSDDDDNMTPAQSRRKAQNRAAYALHLPPIHKKCSNTSLDNAHSANAKSAMSKTSKPSWQP
jgi:AP-1-like transcription factor